MPRLTVHGADLHYDDTDPAGSLPGAASPVVFAHGLLWSGAMFEPQVRALQSRHRCVCFDFRGQGLSARTATGYDMDTLADDAAAVIRTLGVGPCHFVGLSMGGFVGLRLAAYHPGLLRSLTLIASAADEEPRHNVPRYSAMATGARVVGLRPFAPAVMKIMFGEAFLTDVGRTAERNGLRDQLLALDPVAVQRAVQGVFSRRSVVHLLPGIRVPTQVLSGDGDRAVVPERARRTAEAIPGGRFVSIPRAGHTTTLEEPDAVSRALDAFFTAQDGAVSGQNP